MNLDRARLGIAYHGDTRWTSGVEEASACLSQFALCAGRAD